MIRKVVLVLMTIMLWSAQAQTESKTIELDDIVTGKYGQRTLPAMTFMADGQSFARLEDSQRIVQYSLKTGGKLKDLLSSEYLSWEGNIEGFTFSKDNNFILFWTDKEKIYRRSYDARYYLYDVRLKQLNPIADGEKLRMAILSPDARKVAYVKDNNIFVYHVGFKSNRQITEDGEVNKIINGVPDWVYEEEFETNRMMEWSPDSRFLAWVRFDESEVAEFSFPLYLDDGIEKGYLDNYVYKYPKAGAENSVISAHVYDYDNNVSRKMKVDTESEEVYLPRIFWTKSAAKLGIARINRHQNDLQILFANPKSGLCSIVLSEKNERYIDQQTYEDIVFLEDGEHFVYQSEKDGYNHLYLYDLSGRMVKQLTSGEYDVTEFYGYDTKYKKYYFQAAKKSPTEREVYSLDAKGNLTCLTPESGTNSVIFSADYSYSIRSHSSVLQPFYAKAYDKKSNELYTIVENVELEKKLSEYTFVSKEFVNFKAADGQLLNGWMVKPKDFDEGKQYPVLMVQYSGPGAQLVLNKFSFGWEYYLSQQGYMVVCVDGRGTGARGEEFKKCTYLQLGHLESDDQIAVAHQLADLPYVDGNRIGIWGWSYGGFMTALCMSRGEGVFKAGISVAPVTHYKFYDTIYTERYMRTPQENPDGYNNFSPIMLAGNFEGRMLLCHGMADDNVHFQNTADYSEALVQAGKQFEMQVYRNRNHGIYGGNTRLHLYHRFEDFLERNL